MYDKIVIENMKKRK